MKHIDPMAELHLGTLEIIPINLRYLLPAKIQQMQKHSEVEQLRYVLIKINSANYASWCLSTQISMVNHLDGSQVLNFCGHQKTVGKWKHYESVSDSNPKFKISVKVNAGAL